MTMTADGPAALRVSTFIDGLSLRGPLALTPLLCIMLMLTEGIDAFGVGFVGPFLSKHYGITTQELAAVYTGTVIASLIGAVVIAPLADRIGTRRLLIATSLAMGPATLFTALADNVAVLFCLRFVIGLAFGAALPCALSMVSDYAPRGRRSTLLMQMNTGINLGMVLASLGAAIIIPALGWQALLYASATLSMVCTVLCWFLLPESLQHLARRNPADPRGRAIVLRLSPAMAKSEPFVLEADAKVAMAGTPIALLTDGRALQTMLLWFLVSLTYVIINFIGYWLPTLMLQEGATISQTGFIIAAGKLGGVCCAVLIGWLADKRGLNVMLPLCLGVVALAVTSQAFSPIPVVAVGLLLISAFLMAPSVSGTQVLTVNAYPTALRATATGWISGLSRLIGGGVGTLVGGAMLAAGWKSGQIAPAIGGILFLACLTVLLICYGLKRRPGDGSTEAQAEPEPAPAAAAEPLRTLHA